MNLRRIDLNLLTVFDATSGKQRPPSGGEADHKQGHHSNPAVKVAAKAPEQHRTHAVTDHHGRKGQQKQPQESVVGMGQNTQVGSLSMDSSYFL